jgi:hypothetical protein
VESTEAIKLASQYAKQQGYDILQYDISAERDGDEWIVHFYSKEQKPRPGDFFTIGIDSNKSIKYLFPGK